MLNSMLERDPAAMRFLIAFNDYCHFIDDLVDGEKEKSPENICRMGAMACMLYSSTFYQQYCMQLYPIVLVVTNEYADSVAFSDGDAAWKHAHADVMRHCGNNMIMTVVALVAGYDALRKISPLIRENSYNKHHAEDGTPH